MSGSYDRLFLAVFLWMSVSTDALFSQQSFWYWTAGPPGAYVWAVHANSYGSLFAAASDGNLYCSSDSAPTWQIAVYGSSLNFFRCISANSQGNIIAAGERGATRRSTNSGQTWDAPISSLNVLGIYSLTLDDSGNVYAGTSDGFFVSRDYGVKWNQDTTFKETVINTTVFPGVVIVIAYDGIFISHNTGRAWERLQSFGALAATSDTSKNLFIAGYFGVKKSTDLGLTWNPLGDSPPAGEIYSIGVNNLGDVFVGRAGFGIEKLPSGTNQWNQVGLSGNTVWSFAFFGDSGAISGASSGAVHKSTDNGRTWIQSATGISATSVWALSDRRSSHILAGAYQDGLFRTSDYGTSWESLGFTNQRIWKADIMPDGSFLVDADSGFFRLPRESPLWEKIAISRSMYNSFATDDSSNIYLVDRNWKVSKSSDAGVTWCPLPLSQCFGIFRDLNDRILAYSLEGLQYSTDHGDTWVLKSFPRPLGDVTSVVGLAPEIFVASGYGGVFHSTNNGNSWAEIGPPSTIMNNLLLTSSRELFASGQFIGVVHYDRSARSWETVNDGLSNLDTRALALDSLDHLMVSTNGSGVFRSQNPFSTRFPTFVDREVENQQSFEILPPYPNPFNSNANILFNLPNDEFIQIEIYSSLGQLLAVPQSGQMTRGNHLLQFNTTGLPSGSYFCVLRGKSFQRVLKLMLVK